jgi:hypothetical protein
LSREPFRHPTDRPNALKDPDPSASHARRRRVVCECMGHLSLPLLRKWQTSMTTRHVEGRRARRVHTGVEHLLRAQDPQTSQERPLGIRSVHGSAKQSSAAAQVPLTSGVPLIATVTSGEGTNPTVPTKSMTLFMISVPLMALAVALAVLPLIYMSHADHRHRFAEATPPSSGHAPGQAIDARRS